MTDEADLGLGDLVLVALVSPVERNAPGLNDGFSVLRHKAPRRRARSGTGQGRNRLLGLVAVGLVVLAAACGGSVGGGPTSAASFVVGASKFRIDESGTLSVSVAGVPALSHSGPLGCKGQFFHVPYSRDQVNGTTGYELFFRYTAVDAVLLYANNVYHFGKPPIQGKGELVWDAQAPNPGGATIHLQARVRCSLPSVNTPLDAGR
jgi:hypothetical protein